MSYDIELAKILKDRDNPKINGATIGKVVSLNPLNITTDEGQIKLNKKHLYICDSLFLNEYKFQIENTTFTGDAKLKKDGVVSDHEVIELNIKNDTKSKVTLSFEFKLDDEVLLLPSANGQNFFIIDKVRKLV